MNLSVRLLNMRFGGNHVLRGITFEIEKPSLVGLIGPNGAGKSTLTNILAGSLRPTGGAVLLNGQRVDGLPPYAIAHRGFGRTFQIPRPFNRLTVLENLRVAALAMRHDARELNAQCQRALELVGLDPLAHEYARALSGGQKKLLELARLVVLDTEIMMLDEPFAGVHPVLRDVLHDAIRKLRKRDKTFIVISHEMETIFGLSERLLVLSDGQLIADGQPDQVRTDPRVITSYLGEEQ